MTKGRRVLPHAPSFVSRRVPNAQIALPFLPMLFTFGHGVALLGCSIWIAPTRSFVSRCAERLRASPPSPV